MTMAADCETVDVLQVDEAYAYFEWMGWGQLVFLDALEQGEFIDRRDDKAFRHVIPPLPSTLAD